MWSDGGGGKVFLLSPLPGLATHGLRCGLHSLLAAFFHGYVLASLAMTAGEFVCRCLRLIRGDKVFI